MLQIERVLDSFFEFRLDDDDPVMDSAPTATFIGNECHFKTKNGANIIKQQRVLVNDITVIDTFGGTGSNTYNNVPQLVLRLLELNFFQDRVSLNIVGSTRFDTLLDAFSYFGNNGKIPVVDESQQRLVPTTFYNYNLLTQLEDVEISSLIDGKLLGVQLVEDVPKIVLVDNNSSSTTSSQSNLKKISVIAEEGQTQIEVDERPEIILLYKNGGWQIEGNGLDYNYANGTITLHYTANENDYYEIIYGGSSLRKFFITATIDNQTDYNFDGNPSYVDVFIDGYKLREGLDYQRTSFSNNNSITLINEDFFNNINEGDSIELITY